MQSTGTAVPAVPVWHHPPLYASLSAYTLHTRLAPGPYQPCSSKPCHIHCKLPCSLIHLAVLSTTLAPHYRCKQAALTPLVLQPPQQSYTSLHRSSMFLASVTFRLAGAASTFCRSRQQAGRQVSRGVGVDEPSLHQQSW